MGPVEIQGPHDDSGPWSMLFKIALNGRGWTDGRGRTDGGGRTDADGGRTAILAAAAAAAAKIEKQITSGRPPVKKQIGSGRPPV